jgi:hypothetical protein
MLCKVYHVNHVSLAAILLFQEAQLAIYVNLGNILLIMHLHHAHLVLMDTIASVMDLQYALPVKLEHICLPTRTKQVQHLAFPVEAVHLATLDHPHALLALQALILFVINRKTLVQLNVHHAYLVPTLHQQVQFQMPFVFPAHRVHILI